MIEENVFKEVITYLQAELAKVRAGRVSIDMFEKLSVDVYGTKMFLEQLATLSLPETRVIVIRPWDKGTIRDIETALRSYVSDINPVVDGDIIRMTFPAPSEERRAELVKEVRKIVEGAKIKIRQIRETILRQLKTKEEDEAISQDEAFLERDELQKIVDRYNKQADEIGARKAAEITRV